jgi:signal transduction histidine kinase
MTNSADALSNSKEPNIHISIIRESEWIQIQVIDNGCGILKEDMQNIFKPFFTSKSHGTGLGLVIVKKMVSKMFGSIKLESLKDKGTTVTVIFPEGESADDQNLIGD